jgi:ATP-binding cassette, subfamily B, bacterial
MSGEAPIQRGAGAPPLPQATSGFVRHALRGFGLAYGAILLFEALAAGSGIMVPYALSRIIKAVTTAQEQSMSLVESLTAPLLFFVALAVAEVVFGRVVGAIQMRTGPRLRHGVVRSLYHYLQLHSHRYMSSHFAGALAHRISETAMGTLQILWILAMEFWPIIIAIVVATVLLFQAHAQLGWLSLLWSLAFIACSYMLARKCQPYAHRGAAARSATSGVIVDSVTNVFSARLFTRLGFERGLLDKTLAKEYQAIQVSAGFAERIRWFQFSAAAVLKIGMLYFSLRLWGSGRITVGEFVMAVSLSLLLINEARNLARRFLEFFDHAGNVANGIQTIVCSHEVVDRPGAQAVKVRQGHIRFENVVFGYAPGRPIFNGLSVDVPAGQRVGLVGASGSGKSTFVSLLLRLYDLQFGAIRIDGAALPEMTLESLHGQIALIPQEPSLFHRSLRDNIRYGNPEASVEQVVEAARKAHAHEFIAHIPEGYDSMVGERGVKLSGGQRQRIAIARVILKDAPVLILDEATSALDSITESAIQDTMLDVMQGKTVIVVAHRLATIACLDRILVFDQGRIVEDGSHAELLALGGTYARLWNRQSGGFLPQDPDGQGGVDPLQVPPTEQDPPEPATKGADDEVPPPSRVTQ